MKTPCRYFMGVGLGVPMFFNCILVLKAEGLTGSAFKVGL